MINTTLDDSNGNCPKMDTAVEYVPGEIIVYLNDEQLEMFEATLLQDLNITTDDSNK
jgi:hypothetical protein